MYENNDNTMNGFNDNSDLFPDYSDNIGLFSQVQRKENDLYNVELKKEEQKTQRQQSIGSVIVLAIISFFIPLVGIILSVSYFGKKEGGKSNKTIGAILLIFAIMGISLNIILYPYMKKMLDDMAKNATSALMSAISINNI